MRIAQLAPLAEAVPPKLYGGTERVVSWLTEELVEMGHEVTSLPPEIQSPMRCWNRVRVGRCGSTPTVAIR